MLFRSSKRNVETNAGGPALLWGYATIITSLLIYFGWVSFNTPYIMFGWFLIPIIGGIGMIILNKKEKPKLIKTYMDKVINYIWITIGILGGVVSLSAFIVKMPILFFIGVLMCAGIILTGCVIKFKPYIYGGIAGIVLSFICLFVPPLESCNLYLKIE